MEAEAGTNTSCPESDPILISVVCAAYAGEATVTAATPAASPAARAMAWRREQNPFDETTVLIWLLNS